MTSTRHTIFHVQASDDSLDTHDSGATGSDEMAPPPAKKPYAAAWEHVVELPTLADAIEHVATTIAVATRLAYHYTVCGGRGKVFKCMAHDKCPHEVRVVCTTSDLINGPANVECRGDHGTTMATRELCGIHPRFRRDIDLLATAGATPSKILQTLKLSCKADPVVLGLLPSRKQIENRKATLKKKFAFLWNMSLFVHVKEWTAGKECKTKEAVFYGASPTTDDEILLAFSKMTSDKLNQLQVVKLWQEELIDEDGNENVSIGLVVVSRQLLRNMFMSMRAHDNKPPVLTDGTYRLHHGRWTLVDLGSVRTSFGNNKFVQSFVPWMYLFVRSETQEAYEKFFKTAIEVAKCLLNTDIDVPAVSLDNSRGISNAIQSTWPGARQLSCWPHVSRNARKSATKRSTTADYNACFKVCFQWLHECRTEEQHAALGRIVALSWRSNGHEDYAAWFETECMTPPWNAWYVTASGAPGVLANQNPIESHHNSIKKIADKHASTAHILTKSLPGILNPNKHPEPLRFDTRLEIVSMAIPKFKISSEDGGNAPVPTVDMMGVLCPAPLSSEVVVAASRILASVKNYRVVYGDGRLPLGDRRAAGYLINARKYQVTVGSTHGCEVTAQRAQWYYS
jgi:hypothetical protein